jgi:4-amino-4-deoxy-L-arabinose transferase-like glycosyltransferase
VRVLWLGHEPIWRDEAFTALVVQRNVAGMLDVIRNDSAPPLSYLLTHFFVLLMGPAVPVLRLTSALAGTAIVPVVAALARRCAGDRAGLWAAGICALAPGLVASGRDARMYALATTLVALSALALWWAAESPTSARWLLYGLVVLLAIYTQYLALLAIPAQVLALRFALRASWRTAATAAAVSGAAVVALVPWLIYAAPQFRHAETPFWVQPLSVHTISSTVMQFFTGPPVEAGVNGLPAVQILQAGAVVGGVLAVSLLMLHRKTLGRAAGYVALCGGLPLIEIAIISRWQSLVEARYAGVIWGPLFVFVAIGIASVSRAWVTGALAALLVAPTVGVSLATTHPDTPALVAYIAPRLHEHDFVDASPRDYLLLLYYGDANLRARTHIVATHEAWFWGTALYPPDALVPATPAATVQNGGTIYWVDDAGKPLKGKPPAYAIERYQCFSTVCLAIYQPPAPP